MQRANRHRGPGLAALCAVSVAGAAWAQSAPVECKVVDPTDPRLDPIRVQVQNIEPVLADVRVRLEGLKGLRPRIEQDIAVALEGLDVQLAQLDGLDHQMVQLERLNDLGPEISAKVAVALKGMEGKLARLDGLQPRIEAQVAAALAGLDGQLAKIGAACVACPPEGEGGARTIVIQPEGAPKARRVKIVPHVQVEPKVKVRTRKESGEPKVRVRTLRETSPESEVVEVRPNPRVRVIRQRSGATPQAAPDVRGAPRTQGPHTVRTAPRAMALGGVAGGHGEHGDVYVLTPDWQGSGGLAAPHVLGGHGGVHVITPHGLGGGVTARSQVVPTLRVRPGAGVKVRNGCSEGRCPHGCGPC